MCEQRHCEQRNKAEKVMGWVSRTTPNSFGGEKSKRENWFFLLFSLFREK